jgi:hypothetical protein
MDVEADKRVRDVVETPILDDDDGRQMLDLVDGDHGVMQTWASRGREEGELTGSPLSVVFLFAALER